MSESKVRNIHAVVITRPDPESVPGRNVYSLFARPLIGWAVDALKKCRLVTGVFISTRDAAVLEIAPKIGCNVIPRPEELDGERTLRVEIVRHAVTWLYRERNLDTDIVIAVRASIPELNSTDVDNAIGFLDRHNLREMISVGADCIQNDDIRIIHRRELFATTLSNRIGVMKTSYLDVRSVQDIAALQQRYEDRRRFEVTRE